MHQLKLFTGNANRELAESVASHLGIALGKADVGTFSDGEVNVEIGESVRGCDCFVIQPTCAPANDRASAGACPGRLSPRVSIAPRASIAPGVSITNVVEFGGAIARPFA